MTVERTPPLPRRIAGLLPFAILLFVFGCSGRSPDPTSRTDAATLQSSTPRVTVAPARPIAGAEVSFGTFLEAEREAEMVAETDGEIVSIRVREGEHVAEGDTLLVIDDRDEQLALQRDEAEYDWALSQLERAKSLEKQGHVATREVEQASLQLRRAEAALGISRVALSRCGVRAPIAGLAWMIRVEPLHRVVVGQPLLRVTDPDRLRASAYLPAALRGEVRVGTRVRLEPVRGGAPIDAVVSRVDPLTDPASGTFKVVSTFRRVAGSPEAGVEARLIVPSHKSNSGCIVPSTTLVESNGDSTWVWRYEADRVRRAIVRIAPHRSDAIEIESGLSGDCRVVVGTDRPLSDGSVVEVVDSR